MITGVFLMMSLAWASSEVAPTDEEVAVAEFKKLIAIFDGGDCDTMAKELDAFEPATIQVTMKKLEAKHQETLKAKREDMPAALQPLFDAVVETSRKGMKAVKKCKDHEAFQKASKKLDDAL